MSGGKRPSLTGGSPSDEDAGSDETHSVDSTAALQKGKTSDEELEELLRERDPDVVVTSDQEVLEEVEGPLYEQKLRVNDRLFMARLTEAGGRPEDMAGYLIDMIRAKDKQTVRSAPGEEPYPADYSRAERNAVCVGFKLLIAQKRAAIRVSEAIAENPKYTRYRSALSAYQTKLQDRIFEDCQHLTDILKDYCLDRQGNSAETEAFFCKLLADHARYMCEVRPKPGAVLNELKLQAKVYYERATRKCEPFHNCNPTKLSVGLHQALYVADCLKDLPRAIKVAELAMNKALG